MTLSAGATLPNPRPVSDEPLYLVHHHPGYVRMRADVFVDAEEDDATLTAARRAAETAPGFQSWTHNPKTGSVVVEYDGDVLEADDLLKHVAKHAGLRGLEIAKRSKSDRHELIDAILDGVQGLNGIVGQATNDRADLREIIPIALVVTSAVSFVYNDDRGRLPQWSNALYHAYRIFMHWHRREVRTRERVARQKEEGDGR